MDEQELIRFIGALPGVAVQTPGPGSDAPEIAWGDSFFFYDPDDAGPQARRFPFATIVTKDYPGFDTDSQLDRPGVFRLNVPVGRGRFEALYGFPPAAFGEHRDEFDYAALDRLVPHPAYGQQGWVSVVVPGPGTEGQLRDLVRDAHADAARRYERRRGQDPA